MPSSCSLINAFDWPSVFWISGTIGLLWLFLFVPLVSSSPSSHRRISKSELDHILVSRPRKPPITRTPWRAFFRCPSYIAIIATHCCYNWSAYFGLSWISKFFQNAFSADYSHLGLLAVLPYILLFLVSAGSGCLADQLEINTSMSPTSIRKLFNTLGQFGSALSFFGLAILAPGGGSDGHASGVAALPRVLACLHLCRYAREEAPCDCSVRQFRALCQLHTLPNEAFSLMAGVFI